VSHFPEIATNPDVCSVLRRFNVGFFYDDPVRYFNVNDFADLTANLDLSQGFELVDAGGPAAVHRITACDEDTVLTTEE